MDIVTFGQVDDDVRRQMENCRVGVERDAPAVLCADNHLGYSMPIGGVIGYREHISPAAVGYDIGCGHLAVRTTLKAADVDVARVMDELWARLSFGIGRQNAERVECSELDEIATHPLRAVRSLVTKASQQIGTIGGGNHYVDLLVGDEGDLWVAVHFGSRGFGHSIATWALQEAGIVRRPTVLIEDSGTEDAAGPVTLRIDSAMMAPPVLIPLTSELGIDYCEAMQVAGRYAYAGRDWVVRKVVEDILRGDIADAVHNHHNFAWSEQHGGTRYMVHRKGATPAFPGQRGFVGGSMGDVSVIVRGVESHDAELALRSTVHGAGRQLSRRRAAGKTKIVKTWKCGQRSCAYIAPIKDFTRGGRGERPRCPVCPDGKLIPHTREEVVRAGLIDWPAVQADLQSRGIELRGGGADEAPAAYKDLRTVLAYHAGTIEIEHVLRPLGVAMARREEFDPYQD